MLQPATAYAYMSSWNQKSTLDIDEVSSYHGERIRHFSLEAAVVAHMANLSVDYINLSWVLNADHKLTTLFVPISDNKIQSKNDTAALIYDASAPCPPLCDL